MTSNQEYSTGKKQLNWMCTFWGPDVPQIQNLPDLKIAYMQLEKTKKGKLHMQAFVQLTKDRPAYHIFNWCHNKNISVAVGKNKDKDPKEMQQSRKGGPERPHVPNQGWAYVAGDGPCALKKLEHPSSRFIITPNGILNTPIIDETTLLKWQGIRKLSKQEETFKLAEESALLVQKAFDNKNQKKGLSPIEIQLRNRLLGTYNFTGGTTFL